MAYMTNREFYEHLFNQEKRNAYTDALVKEVRRLREENEKLQAKIELNNASHKALAELYERDVRELVKSLISLQKQLEERSGENER